MGVYRDMSSKILKYLTIVIAVVGVTLNLLTPLKINAEEPESRSTGTVQIIHDSTGEHYVMENGQKMLVYCMNNLLSWPHYDNTPPYNPGYLTPDMFPSQELYEECITRLENILAMGYPNNVLNLYSIVDASALPDPSEEQLNAMLVPPEDIKNDKAFKDILSNYTFLIDIQNGSAEYNALKDFCTQVKNIEDGKATSDLTASYIESTDFYKAACSTYFAIGNKGSKQDVLVLYKYTYGGEFFSSEKNQYLVTQNKAYDATQDAVWALLNMYGVPNNNRPVSAISPLAQKMVELSSQNNNILKTEPTTSSTVAGDTQFKYDAQTKQWKTGEIHIEEPSQYNGTYTLQLPDGITSSSNSIKANQSFILTSDHKPDNSEIDQISYSTDIQYLDELKQYSPSTNALHQGKPYQNMAGTLVLTKNLTGKIVTTNEKTGGFKITKILQGSDSTDKFKFHIKLLNSDSSAASLNGTYGDLTFENGESDCELANQETVTVENLPVGIQYEILEETNPEFTSKSENETGQIDSDQIKEITFTNYKNNSLTLKKNVKGSYGDKTKKFEFTIQLLNKDTNTPVNGSYEYEGIQQNENDNQKISFNNGKATVKLKNNEQILIKNLPYNTSYIITEIGANQDGYETTYTLNNQKNETYNQNIEGTLNTNQNDTVQVINTKESVPETGINLDDNPHTPILVGISGLLLLGIFAILKLKANLN